MKMQWVLVAVVLAAVVFGFTYLKLNSGSSSTSDKKLEPVSVTAEAKLYFPQTSARPEMKNPIGAEWEYRVPGHYDFWFENIYDQPIQVGLAKKSCTCTKVEIAVASDDWQKWNAVTAVNLMLRTQGRLERLAPDLTGWNHWVPPEPAQEWKSLTDDNKDPGFQVPPRASGWLRVNWKIETTGAKLLDVNLWSHAQDGNSPPVSLTVPLLVVPPAYMDDREHEKDAGTFSADRPRTVPLNFVCWSSTRSSFTVKPAEGGDPFLVIGKPVPLTDKECQNLQEQKKNRVLSGYRIPVTVRNRLDDGRQIELGPFRRTAYVRIEDEEGGLSVTVTGLVKGELAVIAPEGPDQIQMGNRGYFEAAFGDVKEATLETRNLDLNLALDKAPSFLRVDLREPKITQGIKTWSLRVEVPKRAVAGEFPRDDNPEYRDSAIYLIMTDTKFPSETVRRIRIPVSGKASSR